VSRKIMLVAVACSAALGLTAVAQAAQAPAELQLVELPAERFQRAIETHQDLVRYEDLFAQAKRLHAAPKEGVLGEGPAGPGALERGIEDLRERIEKAQREPEFGLAPGVAQATLDAIAACESGGDPTAVNAAGYYGKYQFDTGTWASVGGSGNPAAASEAEQDYRASLLYARAGSSPWPVCGV
jgi:soluble lytic murein transglycosylase-like protein